MKKCPTTPIFDPYHPLKAIGWVWDGLLMFLVQNHLVFYLQWLEFLYFCSFLLEKPFSEEESCLNFSVFCPLLRIEDQKTETLPFEMSFEYQMLWNGKKHSETPDIGWYKLKLKVKYEKLGKFKMPYHASLSYLHEKRNSSAREVLDLNICHMLYSRGSELHFSKS